MEKLVLVVKNRAGLEEWYLHHGGTKIATFPDSPLSRRLLAVAARGAVTFGLFDGIETDGLNEEELAQFVEAGLEVAREADARMRKEG